MFSPHFFRMPRELRDEIYDLLLLGSAFQIECYQRKVSLYYRKTINLKPNSTLPTWLLTSKQILVEGLEQLYLRSSGIENRDATPLRLIDPLDKDGSISPPVDPARKLLNLDRVRYLVLSPIIINYFTPFPVQKPATLLIAGASYLGILEKWIPETNKPRALKSLVINFFLDSIMDPLYSETDWECELFPLSEARGLQKVTFEVKKWEFSGPKNMAYYFRSTRAARDPLASEAAKSRLKMTIQDLAPSMLDREKKDCIFKTTDLVSTDSGNVGWRLTVRRA